MSQSRIEPLWEGRTQVRAGRLETFVNAAPITFSLQSNKAEAVFEYSLNAGFYPNYTRLDLGVGSVTVVSVLGRDAQPALVIGRRCATECDSAPVQYNGIV